MKKIKTIFLLLISVMLLTGCNSEVFTYSGEEQFFELSGADTDTVNAEGAKVIVGSGQAFVEINEETRDYDTYVKGEHKIKKKDGYYRYYFVNMNEVTGNKYGTEEAIKINDETYGELELNVYGEYDYRITNIKDFANAYVKVDPTEFLEIQEFVNKAVVDTIVEEVVKLEVKFSDLPSYAETIKQTAIKTLEDKGITCSRLEIQSIGLTNESMNLVQDIESNAIILKNYIQNTTWIASDKSEMIFDKDRFNWYLNQNDHTDNVQYGSYIFYSGDLAVDYITTDLKSFGVTRSELDTLFASNEKYDASNFVVFNIKLEGYTINGQSTTLNKDIYWYGFLLNNNQNLQVVNMITATYYNFTKK